MGFHRSKTDLIWTDSGDFFLDATREDLADTSSLPYRAFIQQITTRLSSSLCDWRLAPTIGTGLNQFLGKPNTAELGANIQAAVTSSLTRGSFMKASEFQVQVFPLDKHNLAIFLMVQPSGDREQIRLSFTYSTQDNKVVPRKV